MPLKPSQKLTQSHPQVGVIGGTNGTGKQFARLFKKLGFKVKVSGRKTKVSNQNLAEQSDILIFAPPLKTSTEIIKETVKCCKNPEQIILDVCSIKEPQIKAMQKARGHVIGLHPLFGSRFKDVSKQDIIICCPKRSKYKKGIIGIVKQLGMIPHEMTASEHDKLMATIQVIPHLSALISGTLFKALKIHPENSLKICSPVYKTELCMIGRIYSQNPALYASIIGQNKHSKKIAQTLKKALDDLIPNIEYQDVDALEKKFTANQKHFGPFAKQALKQSQKLLNNWK